MTSPKLRETRVIDLITAPYGEAAGVLGSEFGPEALLDAGLIQALETVARIGKNCEVNDLMRLDFMEIGVEAYKPTPHLKTLGHTKHYNSQIFLQASESFDKGCFPVLLAGDHSLSIGSIIAAKRNANKHGKRLVVLYIDAHADFNTPVTTPTGNIHGMTLAAASGLIPQLTSQWAESAYIEPSSIVYWGVRDVDANEKKLLDKHRPRIIEPKGFHYKEAHEVMQRVLADPDTWVHVSFDVDSLDPLFFRSTGLNVPEGLTLSEVCMMFEDLSKHDNVKSLDVVEYNPSKDQDGLDAKNVINIVTRLFT